MRYGENENYGNMTEARKAEKVKSVVRNWMAFDVPNGQVVYRGRYYFAWRRGRFVGAYDSLDDAIESLNYRNGGNYVQSGQRVDSITTMNPLANEQGTMKNNHAHLRHRQGKHPAE